jgi:hypothetical protein
MIGWIKQYTKRVFAPDPAAPQLLGPDRTPSFQEAWAHPLFRVYDPNSLSYNGMFYGPNPLPIVPNGPGGPQNFNADCARQPQTNWSRASDGQATMDFFRRLMKTTGLEHV